MNAALPLPEQRLLTTEQAANYCGVSATTFRSRVRIAPVKIGNSVRYDRQALDRWISQQTSTAQTMTIDDWLGKLDEGEGVGR